MRRALMCHLALSVCLLSIAAATDTQTGDSRVFERSCGSPHQTGAITVDGKLKHFDCFYGRICGTEARVEAYPSENATESLSLQFLSHPRAQSCRVRVWVGVTYLEGTTMWTAYRQKGHEFGSCLIRQSKSSGLWQGHATALLVVMKGNNPLGSPTRLHAQKDVSGKTLSKTIDVTWHFETAGRGEGQRR